MFTRVRHIAFNTEAERQLCRSVFGQFLAPNSIVGCGIEMAPEAEWSGVKAKYELPDEYVLYLGRVSKAKVDKLLPYFLRCKAKYGGDAKLIHLPEIGIKGSADSKTRSESSTRRTFFSRAMSPTRKKPQSSGTPR